MAREKDISEYSEDDRLNLDPYGQSESILFDGREYYNEPENNVPQAIIDSANSPPDTRNPIIRRRLVWGILQGWKTNPLNVEEAYGPTMKKNQNSIDDGTGDDYPYGYIAYRNQLIVSGTHVTITPTVFTSNIAGLTVSPDLPTGLSLDNSGVIEGTPTQITDSTRYTVQSTTFAGDRFRTTFRMQVYHSSCVPVIDYTQRSVAATGVAFNLTPTTWTIPTGSFPTVNPTLPTGLTFTSATGVISGTPTAPQAFRAYTVRTLGADPLDAVTFGDAFNLAVCGTGYPSAVYSFTTTSFPTGVSKTVLPTTWANIGAATISPTLPTGLSFTQSNGAISGTPSVATLPKVYTVAYSGTGGFASITDSLQITFNTCSVTNTTPSTMDYEIIPITTSAGVDWPTGASFDTFIGDFKIIDYTVSPPSSTTLTFGKPVNRHPIKYVVERSTNYRCNILLRAGSYPAFIFDKKSQWHTIHKNTGAKGIRFISESVGSARFVVPGWSMYFRCTSGSTGTVVPGAVRDISFSGCYFSGTPNTGVGAIIIQPLGSSIVVPGLHFYDCTFDGKQNPSHAKWLIRDYNAADRRFIRCTFKDNWRLESTINAVEHGYYNTGDFGVNFFRDCLFSGLGRNAIQARNTRSYSTDVNNLLPIPVPKGGWVLNGCSAIECGMGSWSSGTNGVTYTNGSNGSVYYTFASVSAVWMQNCIASGGYTPVNGTTYPWGTGALVVWLNPNYTSLSVNDRSTDPNFYGTQIVVLSGCTFDFKALHEFDLMNIRNVRQLWVSGGTYKGSGKAILQLSSHAVNGSTGNEEQGYNPNNLPYIASSFFNFPLNSTTFPGGYPPYVRGNCLPYTNCTVLTQTQFEALVNAVDQPPPTPPSEPAEGSFLYQGGWTNPHTGLTTA